MLLAVFPADPFPFLHASLSWLLTWELGFPSSSDTPTQGRSYFPALPVTTSHQHFSPSSFQALSCPCPFLPHSVDKQISLTPCSDAHLFRESPCGSLRFFVSSVGPVSLTSLHPHWMVGHIFIFLDEVVFLPLLPVLVHPQLHMRTTS